VTGHDQRCTAGSDTGSTPRSANSARTASTMTVDGGTAARAASRTPVACDWLRHRYEQNLAVRFAATNGCPHVSQTRRISHPRPELALRPGGGREDFAWRGSRRFRVASTMCPLVV
jgi:hypothetical protein